MKIEEGLDILKQHRDLTQKWADSIALAITKVLVEHPETRKKLIVIYGGNAQREIKRLTEKLKKWYLQAVSGNLDERFWRYQWYIGALIHAKHQIPGLYMLGAINAMLDKFMDLAIENLGPEEGLKLYRAFKNIAMGTAAALAEAYRTFYLETICEASGLSAKLLNNMVGLIIDEKLKELLGRRDQ